MRRHPGLSQIDHITTLLLLAQHSTGSVLKSRPFPDKSTKRGWIIPINMKGSAGQKHILLTNYLADSAAEIDLHACEWKLPDSIEDADITFAGKRLSTIDEEGRREASQASDLVSITYKIKIFKLTWRLLIRVRVSNQRRHVKPIWDEIPRFLVQDN